MTSVVFLHGFLGAPGEWSRIVASLDSITGLAIPLPVAEDWDATVDAVVQQLPKPCVLVGYSMGARLALGCSLACPERVAHLCFASGNPGLTDAERSSRRAGDERLADRLTHEPAIDFLKAWYDQLLFSTTESSIRDEWIKERGSTIDTEYQAHLIRTLSVAHQPNYWNDLKTLKSPLTVVAGERDEKYVNIGRRIVQASDACLEIVRDSGHAVHREQPKAFAAILQNIIHALAT